MSKYYAQWIDGYEVVWRNLTKSEYNRFKHRYETSIFKEPMDIALEIYSLVQVEGPKPQVVPAGIPAYICKQQLLNNPFSGKFEDIQTALGMARQVVAGDYLQAATAMISATFNYKPEELENWEPNLFFLRLAQAELASGGTFDPINPRTINEKVINKRPARPLSSSQIKALERTRDRDRKA